MYRYYPIDDDIETESWMVEELRRNPPYVAWGPGEDCMFDDDVVYESWAEFTENFIIGVGDDDYDNRSTGTVVHWYFRLDDDGIGAKNGKVSYELQVVLWVINLKTGISYGLIINSIKRSDLSDIYLFIQNCGKYLCKTIAPDVDVDDLLVRIDKLLSEGDDIGWHSSMNNLISMIHNGDDGSALIVSNALTDASWPTEKILLLGKVWRSPIPRESWDRAFMIDDLNETFAISFDKKTMNMRLLVGHPRKGACRIATMDNFSEEHVPLIIDRIEKIKERVAKRFSCEISDKSED